MAGKTKYQLMLESGATEDELRQVLEGRGVAQSYTDRQNAKAAAAAAAQPTYSLPADWFNGMSRIGEAQGWKIDDSDSATWQQIAALANAGNTQGAINLANQLAAQGKFGGYYDENGNYWGFAQGYTGGANASMQPVIGGKILTNKGLESENTGVWLTPDNKALSYGQGGTLTDNGETWGTTETNPYQLTGRWFNENQPIYGDIRDTTWTAWEQQQGWDPAETQQHMAESGAFTNPALNTPQGNQKRLTELQANPNADPAAIASTQQTLNQQSSGGTIYQQAVNQADAGGTPTGGGYSTSGAGAYVPSQKPAMTYDEWSAQNGGGNSGGNASALTAPEAYDPSSSQAMADWKENYGIGTAPTWDGGSYKATDNTMYQDYIDWYQNNKAPEYGGSQYDPLRDQYLGLYGQEYGGDPYKDKRDAALEAAGEEWGGSQYQPLRDQYLQNAANMEWNYDPNTDPVWQAYQKQYRREGQRATEDTMGRMAGMTGGMPSSYAVTAASQAGNYYASQLSDKLPQLYQDAYNRYLDEYKKQLGLSEAYGNADITEYGRWLDRQNQNINLADRYYNYGQQDYNQWSDQQGRYLNLADRYGNLGQEDYNRYRDSVDDYNNELKTRYQMALDNIGLEQGDWERQYGLYQDERDAYNKDRDFYYGVGQNEIANGRDYWKDQYGMYQDAQTQANYEEEQRYKRYRDEVEDQRYDQEWAQKLLEYADNQGWKWREWNQYLTEYGDQLSQQEREWAYKVMRDQVSDEQDAQEMQMTMAQLAAKYGDYSGLNGLGIDTSSANPKEVAYASDGSTYKFNTQDALYFVQNAPNGTAGNPTTMKGSDGSIWRKDEYGNVTITTKNGKTFTYNNNTPAVTGSGKSSGTGSGRGSGSGSGSGGSDNDAMSRMSAAGISSEGEAYNWLLANGYGVTAAGKLAKYYAESLGNNNGSSYSDDDVSRAWDIINGKYPNANQAAVTWAQQVLGETSGLDFGTGGNAGSVNDPTYANHSDGRPQSSGFSSVLQQADTLYGSRGDLNGAIDAIRKAYEAGKIHEYEIDIIMDRLGL